MFDEGFNAFECVICIRPCARMDQVEDSIVPTEMAEMENCPELQSVDSLMDGMIERAIILSVRIYGAEKTRIFLHQTAQEVIIGPRSSKPVDGWKGPGKGAKGKFDKSSKGVYLRPR
jgi:hypothetical protein